MECIQSGTYSRLCPQLRSPGFPVENDRVLWEDPENISFRISLIYSVLLGINIKYMNLSQNLPLPGYTVSILHCISLNHLKLTASLK